jgi:hypothetical protein
MDIRGAGQAKQKQGFSFEEVFKKLKMQAGRNCLVRYPKRRMPLT